MSNKVDKIVTDEIVRKAYEEEMLNPNRYRILGRKKVLFISLIEIQSL